MIKTTYTFENKESMKEAYSYFIRIKAKKVGVKKEHYNAKSVTTFFNDKSRIRMQDNNVLKIWEY